MATSGHPAPPRQPRVFAIRRNPRSPSVGIGVRHASESAFGRSGSSRGGSGRARPGCGRRSPCSSPGAALRRTPWVRSPPPAASEGPRSGRRTMAVPPSGGAWEREKSATRTASGAADSGLRRYAVACKARVPIGNARRGAPFAAVRRRVECRSRHTRLRADRRAGRCPPVPC